jgi:DNA-binding transcriptional regulator YiaG
MDAAKRADFAVWWSEEDGCFLARAIALQAGTGYGETPAAALAEAITLAAVNAELGHRPAARPFSGGDNAWGPDAVRELRRSLALSQAQFARLMNVSKEAVEHWEQGIRNPAGSAARLMSVVAAAPGMVHRWTVEREPVGAAD